MHDLLLYDELGDHFRKEIDYIDVIQGTVRVRRQSLVFSRRLLALITSKNLHGSVFAVDVVTSVVSARSK